MQRNPVCSLLLMIVLVGLVGCGGSDGPKRYSLSGNVTYNGSPVPTGTVSFDPVDGQFGGGFAPIENGKYDTNVNGRGHLGGNHVVTITGTDGTPVDPNDADKGMRQLFPPYETTVDLGKRASTMDFEVPGS
jgi:hypothetical protein